MAGFTECIAHVRSDPARLTGHVVFCRTILVIGHHRLHLAARVFLMLLEQVHQLFVLRDTACGCLSRGDNSLLIIDHTMVLVTWSGVAAAFAHQCRIRIALTHHPIVDRLVISRCTGLFQFALGGLISTLQRRDQLRRAFDNRFLRRIGVDETRIYMQLAPIHQSRFHALRHCAHKQVLKHFLTPACSRFGEHAVIRNLLIQGIIQEP